MRTIYKYLFIAFLSNLLLINSSNVLFSQNAKIDSLKSSLKTSQADTNRIKTFILIGRSFGQMGEYDSCITYSFQAQELSEKLNYLFGESSSLANLAIAYKAKANYPLALDYNFKALKIREQLNDKKQIAASYNNIAIIYKELEDYEKALAYNFKSLKIKKEINDQYGIAASYNNIAVIYRIQENQEKALDYYFKAFAIREVIKDESGIALSLNNIGNTYTALGDNIKARNYIQKSLVTREKLNDKQGIVMANNGLALVCINEKKYKEAEGYALKSLSLATELHLVEELKECEKNLSIIYQNLNNPAKALQHYKSFIAIKDSMFTEENTKKEIRLELTFEYDKKVAAVKLIQEKKDAILLQEKQKQQIIFWSICGILILVLIFSIFMVRSYRQKQKANIELIKQKEIIEEHQKEVFDSIAYAKRIQYALLASDSLLKNNLPEHFVLFKPKDVVSGDFYWATPTLDGFIYITADCTGHGIPGAFMSLLNISKLSQTINENKITRPDLILNNVRTEIIKALNPEGTTEESKDGMDAVLCKLDIKKMKLEYAAANNSFYIIRKSEIIHCKADKMPVGKGHDDTILFKNNEIQLEKGDVIYTFTDGYADQFGGPKGKKFKYKQLEELLLSIHQQEMTQQKESLDLAFENWKGQLRQIDDVCILGFRI